MRKRIARSVFILVAILVGWATAAIAQDAGRPRVSPEVPIELPEIEEEIETMSTPNYWVSTTGRWDDTASWSLGHPQGNVWGSAIESVHSWSIHDLRQDYP